MKRVLYIITGAGVTILLYSIALLLVINPMIKSSGESPESYMGFALMVILPLCLLVGSIVSGYLAQPFLKQRSALEYLVMSPGFYLAIAFLIPALIQARTLERVLLLLSIRSAMIWIFVSFVGTRLGVFFRDKKGTPGTSPET